MQSAKPMETSFRCGQGQPAAALCTPLVRLVFCLLAGFCLLFPLNAPLAQSAGAPGAFVTGLEDVPLMPDLQDVPDAAVIFDKPSGRLVEAYAEGDVEPAAVLAFYRETLPQLGWSIAPEKGATGAFVRESERLEIHVLEGQPRRTVRFVLSPR